MLQILEKNNFITDTLFSDICSENFLENKIKEFDNIALVIAVHQIVQK